MKPKIKKIQSSEKEIHEWFIKHKKTLAFAESCTGGRLASLICAMPGCSSYFLGSLVVYSNQFKKDFLQVQEKTLKEKGAISQESVEQMLEGVFAKTSTDYAIAVTGIAGPSGATCEKPVGTIWVALGERKRAKKVFCFIATGKSRHARLTYAVKKILDEFYAYAILN